MCLDYLNLCLRKIEIVGGFSHCKSSKHVNLCRLLTLHPLNGVVKLTFPYDQYLHVPPGIKVAVCYYYSIVVETLASDD